MTTSPMISWRLRGTLGLAAVALAVPGCGGVSGAGSSAGGDAASDVGAPVGSEAADAHGDGGLHDARPGDTEPGVDVQTGATGDTPSPGADPGDGGGTDGPAPDGGGDASSSPPDAAPERLGEWPPPTALGGDRPAPLRLPTGYDAKTRLPLVVLLGGYDFLSADLDAWLGVSDHADADGFLLLTPDGLIDSDGSPFWNATDTCCDYDETGVDDSGYLQALIAEAKARLAVDGSRVVLVGHSAGAFMAYRVACDAADAVSAIVSIAGSSWIDASKCLATRGISVLQIHGLDDDTMPFAGDSEAPGALEVLARWAARAGCDVESWAPSGPKLDLVGGPATESTASAYAGCQPGLDIRLWAIPDADHYPGWYDSSVPFTPLLLDWALAHPLAESGATPSSWTQDIQPLLAARGCTAASCHGAGLKAWLNLETLDSLLEGGAHGPAIVPCQPESSLLLDKLGPSPPFGLRMPIGGSPLSGAEMETLSAWIAAGADVESCD